MVKKTALVACIYLLTTAASALSATRPIIDESLRHDILQATFPKATISLAAGRSIDRSWNPEGHLKEFLFPDALAMEKVYRVVGTASDPVERCAASDVTKGDSLSETREVRFQVYAWPGTADRRAVLAVLQYEFSDANPPASCLSIARISRVEWRDGEWHEAGTFVLGTIHHNSLQRIELIDLAGDHNQELLIESDLNGAGFSASNLVVFSLSGGQFVQWLNVPSRVFGSTEGPGEKFVQMLDIPKTMSERARRFCFHKITFARGDEWLSQPLKTEPCYPRFTGDSAREVLITPGR